MSVKADRSGQARDLLTWVPKSLCVTLGDGHGVASENNCSGSRSGSTLLSEFLSHLGVVFSSLKCTKIIYILVQVRINYLI